MNDRLSVVRLVEDTLAIATNRNIKRNQVMVEVRALLDVDVLSDKQFYELLAKPERHEGKIPQPLLEALHDFTQKNAEFTFSDKRTDVYDVPGFEFFA